jgi:sec-independent protein translocase protein TatC
MATETPNGEDRMSFWGHLEELRKRIVYSLIALAIGFGACFYYSEDILGLLMLPMNAAIQYSAAFPFVHFEPNKTTQQLFFTTLTEPFMSHLKIGFISGIILVIPAILYQLWKFISPGLLPHERKYAGQFVFFSTLFFAAGVLFCYLFLLPMAIPFLVAYKTAHLKAIIKIGDYIDFTLKFLLASGAVFELPLGMLLLGRMGIIGYAALSKFRKYAFLISFLLGAIITPTPDVFNMTMMSIPIYLLYELGILGVRVFGRKKGPESTELTET